MMRNIVTGIVLSLVVCLAMSSRAEEGQPKQRLGDQVKKLADKLQKVEAEYVKARAELRKALESAKKDAEKASKKARDESFKAFRARNEKARKKHQEAYRNAQEKLGAIRQLQIRVSRPRFFRSEPRPIPEEERLGVRVRNPNSTLAAQLGLAKNTGMVVTRVDAKSAADKAGLKDHDILVQLNAKPVPSDLTGFRKLLAQIKAGDSFGLEIIRQGKRQTIKSITLPESKPAE